MLAAMTSMSLSTHAGIEGFLTNGTTGVASRFLSPDQRSPIPVVVDMETLPTGITTNEALTALTNALEAWSAVTSLRFAKETLAHFGQSAEAEAQANLDGRIYVQMHDLYGTVTPGRLGVGGNRSFVNTNTFPGGGLGGRVGIYEFDESAAGHATLCHTCTPLQVASAFEEVLAHEIGHALSLAHASDTEAIMHATAHLDGRGAALNTTDILRIQMAYPTNTPPFSYPRMMEIITSPSAVTVSMINAITLKGYDWDTTNLTVQLTNTNHKVTNGTWSLTSTALSYAAGGTYGDTAVNPSSSSFLDMTQARFSDGTNLSPPALIKVWRYSLDFGTVPSDGLPDYWMTQHFGTTIPSAGALSRSGDDKDDDGLTNLEEFIHATDPTNATSYFRISMNSPTSVTWRARSNEVYELYSANSVTGAWTLCGLPVLSSNSTGLATDDATDDDVLLYRIEKVP